MLEICTKNNFELPGKNAGDYNLQIIDAVGRIYEIGKVKLPPGGAKMEANISKLSLKTGVLLLKNTLCKHETYAH